MMATEATLAAPVDASVHSDSKLTTDADNDTQHVNPNRAKLNGSPAVDDLENKHITGVEDQINSADVSVSGGSDTEASRAARDGEKGHGRNSSAVKKPATFKAVSVNKTFLAAKGVASTTASKPTDKNSSASVLSSSPSGTSMLSVSRPRLVAKTGSGAGNVPRLNSAANGANSASGPDPNVVWNKNRPVPVPEPKKLTDEELKKYGIHMANRLAPESAQAQGNWADIEDDDDDWAPETITWTDGTKTTLPHPDEAPIPPPEPAPAPAPPPAPPKEKPLEKPKSPIPPRSVPSPSVKPGTLPSGKGLILKGGSADKPTLVAKPPAPPTPVKSPWATLPPVEKAPPVVTEHPPSQPPQGGHRFGRDQPGRSNSPPPYAREIAADDFNRSAWREGPGGGNRELYNSHSGRYEPVADRRGSFRSDAHPRQPPLLQRPSQSDHPEPSAAFQTSRTTMPDGPFGRRRGSSNVSGGSGSYLQRPGKGHEMPMPPPDLLNARRTSIAASVESPVSPRNFSPSGLQHGPRMHANQPWQPRASPGTNYASLHPAGPPPPDARPVQPPPMARLEEDLELQKKIMREKRELAMQRRREEEAREEAARRERIKAKLEAMGPPPERKSTKKDSPEEANANQVQPTQGAGSVGSDNASQSRDSAASSGPSTVPTNITNASEKPAGERPMTAESGRAGGPANPWDAQAPQQERLPTWGSASQQTSRNVWGSPNNDRGLGNGTFTTDIARLAEAQAGQLPAQNKKGPAPIAPPITHRAPNPLPVSNQTRPPTGSARDLNEMRNKWANSVLDSDKTIFDERRNQRLERDRQLSERGLSIEQAQASIKDTWRPSGETRREVVHHDVSGAPPAGSILPPTGPASSHPRPSRFFPPKDSRNDVSASAIESSRPSSPSPPPPDMLGHPAYDGDARHPHVSLPRPHPVVKLPPSAAAQSASSRAGGPFSWASPAGYKEPGSHARAPYQQHTAQQRSQDHGNENWQDRINNLLTGRKPNSPPKAPGVEPVSKSALDYSGHYNPATVSLPRSASHQSPDDSKSFTTKPMAEECFEEQEMGSLPQIKFPKKMSDAAWHPAAAPTKPLPRRFWVSDIESVRPLWFPHEMSNSSSVYHIRLPGMSDTRVVPLPSARSTSNPRRSGGRGGQRGSGSNQRGGKGRESSYASEASASAPPPSRGGRGGYRGRGSENWSRRSPASQAA